MYGSLPSSSSAGDSQRETIGTKRTVYAGVILLVVFFTFCFISFSPSSPPPHSLRSTKNTLDDVDSSTFFNIENIQSYLGFLVGVVTALTALFTFYSQYCTPPEKPKDPPPQILQFLVEKLGIESTRAHELALNLGAQGFSNPVQLALATEKELDECNFLAQETGLVLNISLEDVGETTLSEHPKEAVLLLMQKTRKTGFIGNLPRDLKIRFFEAVGWTGLVRTLMTTENASTVLEEGSLGIDYLLQDVYPMSDSELEGACAGLIRVLSKWMEVELLVFSVCIALHMILERFAERPFVMPPNAIEVIVSCSVYYGQNSKPIAGMTCEIVYLLAKRNAVLKKKLVMGGACEAVGHSLRAFALGDSAVFESSFKALIALCTEYDTMDLNCSPNADAQNRFSSFCDSVLHVVDSRHDEEKENALELKSDALYILARHHADNQHRLKPSCQFLHSVLTSDGDPLSSRFESRKSILLALISLTEGNEENQVFCASLNLPQVLTTIRSQFEETYALCNIALNVLKAR